MCSELNAVLELPAAIAQGQGARIERLASASALLKNPTSALLLFIRDGHALAICTNRKPRDGTEEKHWNEY